MTQLEEVNKLLEELVEETGDTVYCRAFLNRYDHDKVIQLEGLFTPDQIRRLGDIATIFENPE